ncbi:hypothetical protein C8Q74DRAFT_1229450 [Fomes fomentarius]|nr:hypothetical protein C8Q74DRAFT_1229450 [Fomes fomentarius]
MRSLAVVGALAVFVSVAAAETTLYIPGFDPQPITADVEGVDAQGRTTYRLGAGVTSGTYEDPAGLVNSATLVLGPSDAHLVYNDPGQLSLSEDCAINNGVAQCTLVVSGDDGLQTATVQETATGFVVQGNAATGLPSGTDSGSTSTPTAGSSVTSGPSPTETGSSPTATGKDNSAGKMSSSLVVCVGFAGLVSAFFL